jgi:hypothetical protein
MVALERWLQGSTVRTVIFLMIGVGAIAGLSLKRRNTAVKLIYEEKSDAQLQSLELSQSTMTVFDSGHRNPNTGQARPAIADNSLTTCRV